MIKKTIVKKSAYNGVNTDALLRYIREHLTVINDAVVNDKIANKSDSSLKTIAADLETVAKYIDKLVKGY